MRIYKLNFFILIILLLDNLNLYAMDDQERVPTEILSLPVELWVLYIMPYMEPNDAVNFISTSKNIKYTLKAYDKQHCEYYKSLKADCSQASERDFAVFWYRFVKDIIKDLCRPQTGDEIINIAHREFNVRQIKDNKTCCGCIKNRLSYAELRRSDLSHMDLSGAILYDANLLRTNLSAANLSNAVLTKASISFSSLRRSKMVAANLKKADANSSDFSEADLSRSNLSKASFYQARFNNANLSHVDLTDSNLKNADFTGACLRGAIYYDSKQNKQKVDWLWLKRQGAKWQEQNPPACN